MSLSAHAPGLPPCWDLAAVGGLHHTCGLDLVAVATGQVISCQLSMSLSLTGCLVTERALGRLSRSDRNLNP